MKPPPFEKCFGIFGLSVDGKSATVLNTGDIAIIGIKTDSADEFSWVPLVNMDAGTQIYFTDTGFSAASSDFHESDTFVEWLVRYTVPGGGATAGTVQTVQDGSEGANYSFLQASGWGQTITNPTSISPSLGGDQIYAFQTSTSATSASFGTASDVNSTGLFGLNYATTSWAVSTIAANAPDGNQSNLYPDLVDGASALAAGSGTGAEDEFDNVRYTGTTSGNAADLLTAITTLGNWERTDTDPGVGGWTNNGAGNFQVVPEPGTVAFAIAFGFVCLVQVSRRNRANA